MNTALAWTLVTRSKRAKNAKPEPVPIQSNSATSHPHAKCEISGNYKLLEDSNDPTELKQAVKYFSTTLGKSITAARVSNNLSRKELAKKINITENIMSAIETGKALFDRKILLSINKVLSTNLKP